MAHTVQAVLDDRDYPIVRLYPERITDRPHFESLCDRWAAVVARGDRFAVISFGDHPDAEPREIGHERALFFKRNRDVFRDRVAVIVNVEPDVARREERREEAAKVAAALGFSIAVVAAESEAIVIARRHLGIGV